MTDGAGEGEPPASPAPPRWLRPLDIGLDAALALTVVIASGTIFAQVVLRYGLNRPISWADEFAVLVFAWMVFIGAAVVQRTDSHISMDSLVRLLPPRGRAVLYLIRVVACAFVLAVMFAQGLALAERFAGVRYPAMGISRAFLYAALPICVPLMGLYLTTSLWHRLRKGEDDPSGR